MIGYYTAYFIAGYHVSSMAAILSECTLGVFHTATLGHPDRSLYNILILLTSSINITFKTLQYL